MFTLIFAFGVATWGSSSNGGHAQRMFQEKGWIYFLLNLSFNSSLKKKQTLQTMAVLSRALTSRERTCSEDVTFATKHFTHILNWSLCLLTGEIRWQFYFFYISAPVATMDGYELIWYCLKSGSRESTVISASCFDRCQSVDDFLHRCMGVHIFGDAKNFCPNLISFFPNNV